jgi:two-component system sensor histidine kinase KdpD
MNRIFNTQSNWYKCIISGVGLVAAVLILLPFREKINTTPIALTFVILVLFIAAKFGTKLAIVMSVISMLCFNYFFLHPQYTLRISDPENWVALFAFLIAALITGGLSGRVKKRAEDAEKKQKQIEKLYIEYREMFQKASQAEAIKQSEQLKSALLDAVTHDLRTPLTSMKAAVTTLLKGDGTLDTEGQREMLEVINTEIDRLNHHLEGLIELAKLEAGAMQPRRTWSSIEEVISIGLARASGITASHEIRIEYEENLPPVRIDIKAIAEVIYLVVENATKYSPTRSEIKVKVQRTDDFLKVVVEDQGAGIPVELRDKVFDKFFRFEPSSSTGRRASGLGMGLAISRGIIEAHGGRIWIEDSSTGKGTRVCFTVPFTVTEAKIEA